jgi:eukaryotic-like serine/threonine-protein kinase
MRFCPRCGSRYEHERFCPEDGAATEPLPDAGPPKDALLGTLVDGRYRIEAQIGEGGMGVVYRVTHIALNKTLALKLLRGEMAKDPEVVQRFMQEAQAATAIGHENIIDINDFGRLPDGTAYFVMEFLNGRPLHDLIKRGGSLPVSDAVQILRQIAGALGAAHERGIVHRDLKPDNVFVLQRNELSNFVKVLDFGIAKVGTTKNKLTRTGMVFGTPHYMSPEQAAGQAVDARTDIYALGVIMYEMFTGRVPFDADTFMGVLTKHMFEQPAPMFGSDVERQLGAVEQITLRALEKKPENRYPSMQALLEDLDRVLGGGSPRALAGQRPSTEIADALEPRSKSELRIEQRLAETQPELPVARRWPYYVAGGLALASAVALVLLLRAGGESVSSPALPAAGAPPLPAAPPSAAVSAPLPYAPAPPADNGTVSLQTEPSGAEIVIEGAVVGHTPAVLPRPERGERTVELRLAGYARATAKLGENTPATLQIALKRGAAIKPATKSDAPTPAPSKARRRPASEVLDPWAN